MPSHCPVRGPLDADTKKTDVATPSRSKIYLLGVAVLSKLRDERVGGFEGMRGDVALNVPDSVDL